MRRFIAAMLLLLTSGTVVAATAAPAQASYPTCYYATLVATPHGAALWPIATRSADRYADVNTRCENKYGNSCSSGSAYPCNEAVYFLQQDLNKCYQKGLSLDGQFGNNTYNAVVSVQRSLGLTADGWAGPSTQRWMLHYIGGTSCEQVIYPPIPTSGDA
jgi:hypothetical protein